MDLRPIGWFLAGFVLLGTFIPYIRSDRWWVRIFDFPRAQLLLIGVIVVALHTLFFRSPGGSDEILLALLVLSLVVQGWHIYPYTRLAKQQVKKASDTRETVKVFVANVLQENDRHADLFEQIERCAPDIILLTEVDQRWVDQVERSGAALPHSILHPLDNTYGMALYSRFPLIDPEVRTLIDRNIPSIRTIMKLKSGREILFHGVHPLPPGIKHPHKNERQHSDQRDAELVVIAREVENAGRPVIIAGDFNDVAWSHTTRLFQRTSRLLDPRVGRGFYNSFNAKSHFFRYPLDHLFHSDHFTVVQLQRMDHFGSDHFPIHVTLNLEPEAQLEQEAPAKKEGDEREAQAMLERSHEKR